jgi:glycosyltransferase involved in cell wall biosynthesis
LDRDAENDPAQQPKTQKTILIDLGATFGGVERYVVNLTKLLVGEADVYALCVLPELAHRLESAGARVVLLPNFVGPLKPLRFIVAAIALPFLLVKHNIQAVQVNGFLESTLMLPARLLGRRAVYTRHGPFELEDYRWYRSPLKFFPRALARASVHLATDVVCVSETVGVGARRIRPPVPVTVVPNWLVVQPPPRAVRSVSGRDLRLLCAGRLERYKGVHLAVEAMRGLQGARLTIVGDGPYRAELEELAAGLPVEFAGFQQEMRPYYDTADIFVMPSLGPEGLPMSSLEAMGMGLPCLFSDLPVHKEMTDDGQSAMLFRCGDADSLRSGLQQMLGDLELRRRLSAAAYRTVRERYTTTIVKPAYLNVFRSR